MNMGSENEGVPVGPRHPTPCKAHEMQIHVRLTFCQSQLRNTQVKPNFGNLPAGVGATEVRSFFGFGAIEGVCGEMRTECGPV